jgi:hypothetical protein
VFVLYLMSTAAAARPCNETESRLHLETITKRDISYVQFIEDHACYVKFSNSER